MITPAMKLDRFRIRRKPRLLLGAVLALVLLKTVIFMGQRFGAFGEITSGFAFMALSSAYSLFLISFLACLGSAASLSSEYASGLLRMVLPRPQSRHAYFLGRSFSLTGLVLALILLDAGVGFAFGWFGFGFADVADPALQGPQFAAGAMALATVQAYALTFFGAAALVALGLSLSVILKTPTAAISTAVGVLFALEGIRMIFREPLASFMVTGYTRLHMDRLSSLARGIAEYQDPGLFLKALLVPLAYLIVANGLGLFLFKRLDVVE